MEATLLTCWPPGPLDLLNFTPILSLSTGYFENHLEVVAERSNKSAEERKRRRRNAIILFVCFL